VKQKKKITAIVPLKETTEDMVYFTIDKEQYVRDNLELFMLVKQIVKDESYDLDDDDIRFIQRSILNNFAQMQNLSTYAILFIKNMKILLERL